MCATVLIWLSFRENQLMKTLLTQQNIDRVAAHYNVATTAIKRIQEWKKVFHVIITGIGSRFLSKSVVYKSGDILPFKAFLKSKVQDWCLYNLKFLSLKHLQSLCNILGIAHSGTKAKLIDRITNLVQVRTVVDPYLKPYKDFERTYQRRDYNDMRKHDFWHSEVSRFASDYKGKQLKAMCKQIKTSTCGGTKRAMACKLMSYINSCLVRGMANYQQALAYAKTQKQQQQQQAAT